jgi:hypothetical protein
VWKLQVAGPGETLTEFGCLGSYAGVFRVDPLTFLAARTFGVITTNEDVYVASYEDQKRQRAGALQELA